MSAFAMFSLKTPSLLSFDKQRAEGNLKTIYGLDRVPCDTRMRERLDPVAPESLRHSFTLVFRQLQRGKALEPMVFLDGHYLVALDGTGYFSSKTIHCDSCLHKEHRNGSITYYHQMLGAAIIHPDFRAVIPLMPEPVVFQKWRWPFLHRPSKGIAVDKQANHDVMHLRGFREADRLADQAFDACPQCQVLTLDLLGVPFARTMHVGIQMPGVGPPVG